MTLFIGGPADGQHINVEENRYEVKIAIQKALSLNLPLAKFTSSFDTDIFEYKREIIACPSKEYSIFVPKDYTCENILECLINNYSGKKS